MSTFPSSDTSFVGTYRTSPSVLLFHGVTHVIWVAACAQQSPQLILHSMPGCYETHLGIHLGGGSWRIFIASWPCGVVTLFAEIFGTESCSQVHGILSDFLYRHQVLLDWFLYDDVCHLYPYSINNATYSKATEYLASVKMQVDKLHIANHVGKWCLENCDPRKEKALTKVNSVVCEQKFSRTNCYKNVKCMNWEHFNLYFLYVLDAGNLKLLGRLREIKPKYQPNHPPKDILKMDSLTMELNNIEMSLPQTPSRGQTPTKAPTNIQQIPVQLDPNTCKLCNFTANEGTQHPYKKSTWKSR